MANLKTLAEREEKKRKFESGHSLCSGCGLPIAVRTILNSVDGPVVASNATGCLEVATTRFPTSAWNIPWIHNAFENAAATISGVESAYRMLKKKGKTEKEINFVAFAGDGGTYDIGLQSLSGALERGHDFTYVTLDNGAYMNTGIQRSSATPKGASTTTAPAGEERYGKQEKRKNLTEIVAAHGIPYVGQASISNLTDLSNKAEKAFNKNGPTFLNVLSTCQLGWRVPPEKSIEIAQKGVDTCFWPLYEVDEGEYNITYEPKEKLPVEEWLKPQKRFASLFKVANQDVVDEIQNDVDSDWEELKAKSS
ncbi:pyruvate ferredoxin oxidoreductase [Candidatus Bipolaricaulota bacterium]|nr:pyruvate ferredoxin oxidoreductase [Candidatus Bipolaricaulota bacterium]MBS3814490.1 pyruvate ferredoxin oxidoreductase [Candidatus Bipolaricaulota bacterium]MBS3825460.1 pyruvate ferredoxin oxidoreductase [Candidatus Bipolaricaulota bacterium]